ncbi:hypothetical protein KAR91_64720 [Candidatus Pacearchaeota archaeon]|nr:hypothetical protein [Candidatus Pacearchaeota archaeon]
MATKIYITGGAINIDDGVNALVVINPRQFDWKPNGVNYEVRDKIDNQSYDLGILSNIQKEDGSGFATAALLIIYLNALMKGVADVAIQDQTTRPIISYFNRVTNSTDLAADGSIGDTTITVTSATGIAVGSYIILFNPTAVKFMFARVTSIAGSPVITLDTPLDFDFLTGTFVDVAVTDLSTANGSLGSPIAFGLRGTGAPPGVDLSVDITRIIFKCTCTSAVDLTTFCNFARLINGLLLRRRNDVYENIFNVKDNGELAGIMYDFQVAAATNPQQGIDGFTSRLTFAGMNKIGVAIRLPIGDDLEFLVQDDLLTAQSTQTITLLEIVAEGHIVQD